MNHEGEREYVYEEYIINLDGDRSFPYINEACLRENNKRVPVKMDGYPWGDIGYADLTLNEHGLYANVNLTNTGLWRIINNRGYYLQAIIGKLRYDNHGNISLLNISDVILKRLDKRHFENNFKKVLFKQR